MEMTAKIRRYSCSRQMHFGCYKMFNTNIETCLCATDLCNSADTNAGKFALGLITTFLLKMIAQFPKEIQNVWTKTFYGKYS